MHNVMWNAHAQKWYSSYVRFHLVVIGNRMLCSKLIISFVDTVLVIDTNLQLTNYKLISLRARPVMNQNKVILNCKACF